MHALESARRAPSIHVRSKRTVVGPATSKLPPGAGALCDYETVQLGLGPQLAEQLAVPQEMVAVGTCC